MKKILYLFGFLSFVIVLLSVLVYGVILLFLYWTYDFNPNFIKIDQCLDSGGTWNYELGECGLKG